MLETIQQIDQALTISINHFHADWLDLLMIAISDKTTWLPLYLGILFALNKYFDRKTALLGVLFIVLNVVLTDQISVFFKEYFMRLRPCHNPLLQAELHMPDGCGGMFGFVSSHAANTAGLFMLVGLLFKRPWITAIMFIYAFLNAYSRVYLAKHFVGDVVAGALLGMAIASLVYIGFEALNRRLNTDKK